MIVEIFKDLRAWINESKFLMFYYLIAVFGFTLAVSVFVPDICKGETGLPYFIQYFAIQCIASIAILYALRLVIFEKNRKKFDIVYVLILDFVTTGMFAYILLMADAGLLEMTAPVAKIISLFFVPQKMFYMVVKAKNEWKKDKTEEPN